MIGISGKENDALYGANQSILEDGKVGLSKITGLKMDKIDVKISPIKTKSDYLPFLHAMESGIPPSSHNLNTLF